MSAEDEFNQVLLEILRQEVSPEAVSAKNLMLRRLATENPVGISRIPAPMNITEIGGYLNLLEKLGHTDLQYGMLSSALGLPQKIPELEFYDRVPVTFFSEFISDRPECSGVKSLPLTFFMRNDLSTVFSLSMQTLHKEGGSLPLLSPQPALPAVGSVPSEKEMMVIIGRCMEIAPSAIAKSTKGNQNIDTSEKAASGTKKDTASDAKTEETASDVKTTISTAGNADPVIVTRDGIFVRGGNNVITVTAYFNETKAEITGNLIHADPLLARAGWYYENDVLKNITGLVKGRTTYGDELSRIYTGAQISASGVRELATAVWNGNTFVRNDVMGGSL